MQTYQKVVAMGGEGLAVPLIARYRQLECRHRGFILNIKPRSFQENGRTSECYNSPGRDAKGIVGIGPADAKNGRGEFLGGFLKRIVGMCRLAERFLEA
ncbi:hypothetical protein SDJN03_01359, partial [Cucurbita argyrosperma subsp. sororia]